MIQHVNGDGFILIRYVADLILMSSNDDMILVMKKKLMSNFDMTDLDLFHYFLGIQVLQLVDAISFHNLGIILI
jgi:hypothetical protein